MAQLRDDSFQILLARQPEELDAGSLDVIRIQEHRWLVGHDGSEQTLLLDQRTRTKILTIQAEQIERIEHWLAASTPLEQFVELRATI